MTQLLREAGVDAVPFDFRAELEEVEVRPLERVPGLNIVATSLELVATRDR